MNPSTSTIASLVALRAKELKDKIAFHDDSQSITYQDLHTQSDLVAKHLVSKGMSKGDKAAIWSPNSINWILAAIGIQKAGGVLVPINTRMKGKEASFILNKSESKYLFTENNFLGVDYLSLIKTESVPALDEIFILNNNDVEIQNDFKDLINFQTDALLPNIEGSDIADIIFTSGTTGEPKGVMVTHSQNLRVFDFWSTYVGLTNKDHYLIVNPFFHTFGYKAGWLAVILRGCTAYPEPIFDVGKILEKIDKYKITMLPGPPTLYQSILSSTDFDPTKINSLRLGVTGAASIPVSLIQQMKEVLGFETIITAYGLTESTGVATMCTPDDDYETIATTSGKAIHDVEIKCVDSDGNRVKNGDQGEILVRGYNVMEGYYDNEDATRETLTKDGWLHTGDVGVLDDRGYLKITDRIKDMFIVGGFNTYPAEIENILLNHQAISQVAVIGVKDERMGEVAKAFIVLKESSNTSEQELIQWAKDNMANYKVPRTIEFLNDLPVNAAGKVMKYKLRY